MRGRARARVIDGVSDCVNDVHRYLPDNQVDKIRMFMEEILTDGNP